MKYIFLLAIISCAHKKIPLSEKQDDLVHVSTVMNQVQASYLQGCVDVYKEMKLAPAFPTCKEKAKEHRAEIQSILDQDL
ncbi:MAG: hypothetical protein ACJ76H_16535 [Bacteriovoracaceae bacterium]